ncbi:sulfatase-like hydrolase/transferase [Tichowtungia aerotolerans]|uniref:Sulfatase-like hydrolase/transferase n=1 Tax=Tichowtungia aerotolerans TaxID=2697043 RepID=A0A6P1M0P6_9BACT|nr:sulfatase-like hydrolase/transferase [Tichowtungia aerotolerans]QHI68369.1 sulfatase-like hydrolase/transferase [Tichowtungia aerotolerans]
MKISVYTLGTRTLRGYTFALLTAGIFGAYEAVAAVATQPNLIFILTDDQRYDTLGCTGNPVVQTPNIDQLATEGTLFTEATVTSAICTPSRASIFAGMYERRHGINFNSGTALSPAAWQQTYPMLLRKAGYFVGYVGKNHVPVGAAGYATGLMDSSFDYWYAGHTHIYFYPKERPARVSRIKGIDEHMFDNAKAETQIEILQEGVDNFLSPNQDFYNRAARFLEKRPADRPFCLSLCFNLPHDAGTGSMEDRPSDPELYKTGYHNSRAVIRAGLPSTYVAKADIQTPKLPADVLYAQHRQNSYDYVDTPETMTERIIRRYQAITGIDQLVGRLRKQLQKLGLAENTVIILTSDHGILRGEFGLGGKSMNYDTCLKVPMIIYDPASAAKGQRRSEQVQTVDIAATLLDYAGADIPANMSGASLKPLVNGKDVPWRTYAFSENLWSTQFGLPRIESVRGEGWKYIRYFFNDRSLYNPTLKGLTRYLTSNRQAETYRQWLDASINGEPPVYEELYHLKLDPSETNNLANDPTCTDRLNTMRTVCQQLVKKARGDASVQPVVLQLESERLEYHLTHQKED